MNFFIKYIVDIIINLLKGFLNRIDIFLKKEEVKKLKEVSNEKEKQSDKDVSDFLNDYELYNRGKEKSDDKS